MGREYFAIPVLHLFGNSMLFREKSLYHQIHPLKLAADILSEPVSLYLLWQHNLLWGLASHFFPPILASALVMSFVDLSYLKASRLGVYISKHMTRKVELARFVGDLVMVACAWEHQLAGIAVGLGIVIAAWTTGLFTSLE